MKSRVYYSTYSLTLTLTVTVVFGIMMIMSAGEPGAFYPLLAIALSVYLSALFFAPIEISANQEEIQIHSSFKIRTVPMDKIVKVERYRPMPGTIRTCASSGFMGYWGTFRDNAIGNYTGYWGNNNDCFLLTLDSGKKYLLGCKDCDAMTKYINIVVQQKIGHQ